MKFPIALLLASLPVASTGAAPQMPAGTVGQPLQEVKEKIIRLIEEKKVPSVSLAVVRDGEIVWEEAFGLVDLDKPVNAYLAGAKLRGGRLAGEAGLIAADMSYSLPSYAEFMKAAPRGDR
jgi:hypothetical protein